MIINLFEDYSGCENWKTSVGESAIALVTSRGLETHITSNLSRALRCVSPSLGVDSVIKKLESYLPPRGLKEWSYSQENLKEGITRSDLISKLGFGTTKALEEAAALLELDPDEYLEELSGWQKRPVESGSSRTRFFSPK